MKHVIALSVVLTFLWLSFSGLFKPIILTLGTISIALTVYLTTRLKLVDGETSPYFRLPALLRYTPWLMKEIIVSNWKVLKAVLSPDLSIHPTLVKVRTSCRSDLAKVIFANSITLTPGTVTVRVEDEFLLVHGLNESESEPEDFEEMDRRSALVGDGKSSKGRRK